MSADVGQPGRAAIAIDFEANPLIPAVIVNTTSSEVLMIGFMNQEAYLQTRETGRTHFWSRSRNTLWKKGETSGHEQLVDRISINCERNALLISVQQIGAVCHEGYPSCFYRDVEDDESLTITMDRWFDPAVVYGGQSDPTQLWYAAYRFLKESPLEDRSSTSRALRLGGLDSAKRIADELDELAGVLEGAHRHGSVEDDLLLEGSQSLYWLALAATAEGYDWDELRLDRALDTASDDVDPSTAARLLRAESESWRKAHDQPLAARIHATMALVAQAVLAGGVEPLRLIERDLDELRSKPYLQEYFAS